MGNYIKLFNTVSAQTAFMNSENYVEPHVSCISDGTSVKYNKSNEPFVSILVGRHWNGVTYDNAYIKSTELEDFVSEETNVHVYYDSTCTESINSQLEFDYLTQGIADYYDSIDVNAYEIPSFLWFFVENGTISSYVREEYPEYPAEEECYFYSFRVVKHGNVPTPSNIDVQNDGNTRSVELDETFDADTCSALYVYVTINGNVISSSNIWEDSYGYSDTTDINIYEYNGEYHVGVTIEGEVEEG